MRAIFIFSIIIQFILTGCSATFKSSTIIGALSRVTLKSALSKSFDVLKIKDDDEKIGLIQSIMGEYCLGSLIDKGKAKLYFKMSKFRSAVVAFNSTLEEFPDTKYREDILFMIVKSNFLFLC